LTAVYLGLYLGLQQASEM